MRIAVCGGNGFVGRALTIDLIGAGHTVTWLSHRPGRHTMAPGVAEVRFDPAVPEGSWADAVRSAHAVVNLSGHPIASRWNPEVKRLLRDSRINTTRALVDCIAATPEGGSRPAAFVCAAGVGYYGDRGDDVLDETEPPGTDWLAELAVQWEAEAVRARDLGCRTVRVRTGLALGDEGLLPKMLLPMRLFVGGPIGDGHQWMPWVHIDDVVGAYRFVIENDTVDGAVNACAPEPVKMRDFAAALGKAVGRPSWLPVPAFALKLVLGEVAPYTLMSQRAQPEELTRSGFRYRFASIDGALEDLLSH